MESDEDILDDPALHLHYGAKELMSDVATILDDVHVALNSEKLRKRSRGGGNEDEGHLASKATERLLLVQEALRKIEEADAIVNEAHDIICRL
ncbi:hypothetical protein HK101_005793 [Irineochytrium annulatum]|nr:hypothetical protein HK101_005793 [Irineochytrium annulatum]